MEDKKYTLAQAGIVLTHLAMLPLYEQLVQNSGSKLNAIKTCTDISGRVRLMSGWKAKYGVIPEETLALAKRFAAYYGLRYWSDNPEDLLEFEAAILDPEHADLPPHTKAELRQLNELLTNRLNTPDVAEWSLGEMHQALSLALSTFHIIKNKHLWIELTQSAPWSH